MSLKSFQEEKRAVYYAINDDPQYLEFTKKSVLSLRRFNKKLEAHLFVFGNLSDNDRDFFLKKQIIVSIKEKIPLEHKTSLKWFALPHLARSAANRLIYLDGDTIVFGKLDVLFERYKKFDFYAREELGTEQEQKDYYIGKRLIHHQMDRKVYDQITKKTQSVSLPVFNTGVMIFNNKLFKKFAKQISVYENILYCFKIGALPYPCSNRHLIDEITASITFGRISRFTYGFIDKEFSPWFIELDEEVVKTPGVVLHVWSSLYKQYTESQKSARF